jgi:predicted ATP-dependent serine protease
MFEKSAFTLYQEDQKDNSELSHIKTYSKDFDDAFGGVLLKSVTVFVGGPSTAKSQLW